MNNQRKVREASEPVNWQTCEPDALASFHLDVLPAGVLEEENDRAPFFFTRFETRSIGFERRRFIEFCRGRSSGLRSLVQAGLHRFQIGQFHRNGPFLRQCELPSTLSVERSDDTHCGCTGAFQENGSIQRSVAIEISDRHIAARPVPSAFDALQPLGRGIRRTGQLESRILPQHQFCQLGRN